MKFLLIFLVFFIALASYGIEAKSGQIKVGSGKANGAGAEFEEFLRVKRKSGQVKVGSGKAMGAGK